MDLNSILPIGSVVLLKKAKKKIVIIGIAQVQKLDEGKMKIYDYLGVPYPEGFMGKNTGLLFNHINIETIVFRGYEDEERKMLFSVMESALSGADSALEKAEK